MEACRNSSNNPLGCLHPPLIKVEMSHIVIDELHLMLRISDILIRNVVLAMIHRDQTERHSGRPVQFVDKLLEKIRSCGISFKVKKSGELLSKLTSVSFRYGSHRTV